MDFSNLDKVLAQDFKAFQEYINSQLEQDEALLCKTFWNEGEMIDFLTYVIEKHDKEKNDLTQHITYLLEKGANTSLNQPVHFILKEKKLDLLPLLLKAKVNNPVPVLKEQEIALAIDMENVLVRPFDINGRDIEGRSILSRAIETDNIDCLLAILRYNPLVNQADNVPLEEATPTLLPLHLAIYRDFGEGVRALIAAHASIDTPFGKWKRPALSIAARQVNVNALEAVLEATTNQTQLDYEDRLGFRPIELLCDSLEKNEKTHEVIRGIAMLLCRKAEMPRNEKFCDLLQAHRKELLKEILSYAGKNPELKPGILRAIHDKNNGLHRVIYDTHSFSRAVKNVAGGYDDLAGLVESLVDPSDKKFTADEIKFAEFIKRYLSNIKGTTFFNRWSGMLTKISQGEVTSWQQLGDYAHANRHSRTALIVNEMNNPVEEVHHNLEQPSF